MKYKISAGLLALLLLAIAGSSCIQTGGSAARAEVSVIKKELTTDAEGNTVLLVTIKNTGRVKADFAEVAVRFYDAGKNLIDSGRDSVVTLNPDETWDFTIPCGSPKAKIASYEVETTTGSSNEGL